MNKQQRKELESITIGDIQYTLEYYEAKLEEIKKPLKKLANKKCLTREEHNLLTKLKEDYDEYDNTYGKLLNILNDRRYLVIKHLDVLYYNNF